MTCVFNPGTVTLPLILPANTPTKKPAVVILPVALTCPAVSKLPPVTFAVTAKLLKVPTEVIFG